MAKRITRQIRVDSKTKAKLFEMKNTLECIEKKPIPLGEIISRMSKGEDMIRRLKEGAKERKLGLK